MKTLVNGALGVEGRSSTAATLQTLLAKLLISYQRQQVSLQRVPRASRAGRTSCDDSMATVLYIMTLGLPARYSTSSAT